MFTTRKIMFDPLKMESHSLMSLHSLVVLPRIKLPERLTDGLFEHLILSDLKCFLWAAGEELLSESCIRN